MGKGNQFKEANLFVIIQTLRLFFFYFGSLEDIDFDVSNIPKCGWYLALKRREKGEGEIKKKKRPKKGIPKKNRGGESRKKRIHNFHIISKGLHFFLQKRSIERTRTRVYGGEIVLLNITFYSRVRNCWFTDGMSWKEEGRSEM